MSLLCAEAARVDHIARNLSIAAFVVSVAVWFVAWLQWRVARNKLRLDLFDRRWKIYAATSTFVDAINNAPERVHLYRNDFNAGTSNAEFLFDNNVVDYIQQIRSHAAALETAHKLSDDSQRDEKTRVDNIKRYQSEREWLIDQVKSGGEMHKTFAPYLGFANIKA